MTEELESQINLAAVGERDGQVLGGREAAAGFWSALLCQGFVEAQNVCQGSPGPAVLSYLWFLNFVKTFGGLSKVRRYEL